MKKINWRLIGIVSVIIVLGTLLLLYKLGAQYMWSDEVFSFHAARMILEKGIPLYDSGLYYSRSVIYNYLLAFSMKCFGINEFGSRVINIPFAIGTTLLIFFFLRDIFRNKQNKNIVSMGGSLLYLTMNFTLASVRETRMYAMTVFFFTLSVIAFYYAFISSHNTKILKIKDLNIRYNLPWILVFIASFLIGYDTQPISIIMGVGLLTYYIFSFIFKRKKESLLFIVAMVLIGLLAVYNIYHTFNVYQVFLSLSPAWATDPPKLLYYPILLVRNLPGIAILSPFILFSLVKYRKNLDWYLFINFIVYVLFISLQRAQHERYLEPTLAILPVLLIISITRIFPLLGKLSKRLKNTILVLLIFVLTIPQGYLLHKELNEIDTYTPTSIAIYKKMQFNALFNYLDTQDLKDTVIIADFHSAMTLYEKGYKVDYILVNKPQEDESDVYFNIPYLVYGDDFKSKLEQNPNHLVILRDYSVYPDISSYVNQITELTEPRVYR